MGIYRDYCENIKESRENMEYTVNELRNPIKILNHISRIKDKITILDKVIEVSYIDDFESAVNYISNKLSINREEVIDILVKFAVNTNLEIHLTDKCNLNCYYCSFKKKKGQLNLAQVERALELFSPKAVTFSGGGENTIHPDFECILGDIHKKYPEIQLGLVTNGVIVKKGEFLNDLSWVRCSLDASGEAEMNYLKGKKVFNSTLRNIEYYLNCTKIDNVGVGFLFSADNIDSIPIFLQKMYEICKNSYRGHLLNLQFRPLRPEYSIFTETLAGHNCSFKLISQLQINRIIDYIKNIEDVEYKNFILRQSNYEVFSLDKLKNYWMPEKTFALCYMSSIYTLMRANGDLYSCIHLGEEDCSLGNIDNIKDRESIAELGLKRIKYINKGGLWCNNEECRYAHINNQVERALSEQIDVPLRLTENYFF